MSRSLNAFAVVWIAVASLAAFDASSKIYRDELQGELERAEGDLSDFEERARRDGVAPGWLR